jgi:hypothetical protein
MSTLVNIEIARTFYFDILYIFVGNRNSPAVMLKDLLKNLGLLIILVGVIILSIIVFTKVQTNASLGLSLGLIIVGLLSHILINRFVD